MLLRVTVTLDARRQRSQVGVKRRKMGDDGGVGKVTARAAGGSQDRPSRRAPGRRDELLGAALDVIRRVGPGASMDEMAAEAGITKPVLYRYFRDRDGLIAAVAERFSDGLVERLEQALAAGAPLSAPRRRSAPRSRATSPSSRRTRLCTAS